MKRWVKPNTDISSVKPEAKDEPPVFDVSIDRLLDDGLLVLSREIRNLKMLSVNGKLSKDDARDLRDHVKLLFDLKERESELLKGKSDDELIAALETPPDETK